MHFIIKLIFAGGSCSSVDITSDEFLYGIINSQYIAGGFIGTIIEYQMQNTQAIASMQTASGSLVHSSVHNSIVFIT